MAGHGMVNFAHYLAQLKPRLHLGRHPDASPTSLRGAHGQTQKGQVLVLFALTGVVLVGFLSLAVDLGSLYVTRRQAQNAADAAALAGAQDATGVAPNVQIVVNSGVQDARRWAIKNGFATDPGANNGMWNGEVRVDVPPATGTYAGQADYIEVRIQRQVNSLFAGAIGISNFTITARAVARAKHIGMELALLSLDPSGSSTTENGSATINVVGSTYSRGSTKNMSGVFNVTGTVFARLGIVGTVNAAGGVVTNPPDVFDPGWSAPTPSPGFNPCWNSNGAVEKLTKDDDGYVWIDPGTYDCINVHSSDKAKFRPGVYHVTGNQGVTINGDAVGTGPLAFVMDNGANFNCQSSGTVNFYSSKSLYNGILIWSADTSNNAVKIAGGNNVTFNGTVYAPRGTARLSGNSGGMVRGQVVSNDILTEGSNGTAVVYDSNMAPDTPGPALAE